MTSLQLTAHMELVRRTICPTGISILPLNGKYPSSYMFHLPRPQASAISQHIEYTQDAKQNVTLIDINKSGRGLI